MDFRIMTRDLRGFKTGGPGTDIYYENNRDFHIDKKFTSYGDVLVLTKMVKSGFSVNYPPTAKPMGWAL